MNEPIRTDDLGDTQVDGIYRGYNVRISFECIQFGTSFGDGSTLTQFQFPFDGTTPGTIAGIGQTLVGTFAKALVLTPVAGINSHNQVRTYWNCIADRDHGGITLNTKNGRLRCNLLALPSGGTPGTSGNILFTCGDYQ